MAKMVFGRMCYEADRDNRVETMHFAVKQNEDGNRVTACGRLKVNWRMRVYAGFSQPENERHAVGRERTNCKSCRKAMGWA